MIRQGRRGVKGVQPWTTSKVSIIAGKGGPHISSPHCAPKPQRAVNLDKLGLLIPTMTKINDLYVSFAWLARHGKHLLVGLVSNGPLEGYANS